MIFGFPYILQPLIKQQNPFKVIVVFDGGKSKERLSLLPNYKKREQKAGFDIDEFLEQKNEVERLLNILGIPIVKESDYEADDLIFLLTKKFKKDHHVTIVSTDKDFNQLISNNVSIWNPKVNKRYTHKNIKSETGYDNHEWVDYLILDGDNSDNIPGLKGVGTKTIRKFLDNYGSIKNYLTNSSIKEDKKFKRSELEEIYLLNRLLIDLRIYSRRYVKLKPEILISSKKTIKRKEIAHYCAKYEIVKFNSDEFFNTFNKLIKNDIKWHKYSLQVTPV
jgi:DNA polymerase-1